MAASDSQNLSSMPKHTAATCPITSGLVRLFSEATRSDIDQVTGPGAVLSQTQSTPLFVALWYACRWRGTRDTFEGCCFLGKIDVVVLTEPLFRVNLHIEPVGCWRPQTVTRPLTSEATQSTIVQVHYCLLTVMQHQIKLTNWFEQQRSPVGNCFWRRMTRMMRWYTFIIYNMLYFCTYVFDPSLSVQWNKTMQIDKSVERRPQKGRKVQRCVCVCQQGGGGRGRWGVVPRVGGELRDEWGQSLSIWVV